MNIVLTHNNMDFDSLAAEYAVSKLYAGVRMVPGYPLVGNVREFLALYRDSLPLSELKYLDLKQVNHIYLVDCQHADRLDEKAVKLLAGPEKKVPYTVFDHHELDPAGLGPGASQESIIKPAGSATTLLVRELIKRDFKISPFEATLFALAIYEDSGCLTYSGTTAEDARCVAYLLEGGADLATVTEFLHPKLSDDQSKLLELLVKNCQAHMLSGSKLVTTHGTLPRYLDGLATLTRKLVEIEAADAVVSVVRMKDRVHIVGRSDSPAVDIRDVVRCFGGDGHPGAGSAVRKEGNPVEIIETVVDIVKTHVKPEKIAQELMTSPVRTISRRTTMEEAGRIMLRYGLDGLVVTEDDDLVGVVSRRDIDQATHHKLGHAPVQGFMSHPVITIAMDTPLSEIQQIMVREDIGRLPVLDEQGALAGLVTRQEVLTTLYGQQSGRQEIAFSPLGERRYEGYRDLLESLDEPTRWLFRQIGEIAADLNMVAYSVGGCVRDLILGRPNFDLDFVIEGSAVKLARALEARYPSRIRLVAKHDRFQTATLDFFCGEKREVDLSTARVEFYEFPAALPTVEASGLHQDLFRRDFTINALAVCLNPGQYGDLIDFFEGLKDLEQKRIRILHPFSFIEDPTRIVRAARFAARLGFSLDSHSRQQAERAIGMGIFDDLGGVRMRTEMRLILESPHRLEALDLLGELGGKLCYLDAHLEYGSEVRSLLRRAERLLEHYPVKEDWVVYLGLLVAGLDPTRRENVMSRLHMSNEHKAHIARGFKLPDELSRLGGDLRRSQIYSTLHGNSDHSLAIAACLAKPGSPLRRMIKTYLEELKDVTVHIKGSDLIRLGFCEGPQIGDVLAKVTEAKLDGKLKTLEDEISFAKGAADSSVQPG